MKFRIIARLDIKKDRLIKGVHLEGLRVVGDPLERALKYYDQGVDELLLIDAVASLYQRNHLTEVIQRICQEIFIPVTVGGGIRSIGDAQALFDAGADKVAINTAAMADPGLLEQLSRRFGAQAVVLSIQAKKHPEDSSRWVAMTDNGRESSRRCVGDWVAHAQNLGIGEILLTSIDQEGTAAGYDIDLIQSVAAITTAPVLASGGFAISEDALRVIQAGAQAAVIAQALHYDKLTITQIKQDLLTNNVAVRQSDLSANTVVEC